MADFLLLRLLLGAMGVALLVVSVCRLRWMTVNAALPRVRHAAVGQLSAGFLLALVAAFWPEGVWLAALAAAASALGWQMATAHAWDGLPASMVIRGAQVTRLQSSGAPPHPLRRRDDHQRRA